MAQMVKSTKDFELFRGATLAPSGVSTENSKAAVILARCAVFAPATAEFRFILWDGCAVHWGVVLGKSSRQSPVIVCLSNNLVWRRRNRQFRTLE